MQQRDGPGTLVFWGSWFSGLRFSEGQRILRLGSLTFSGWVPGVAAGSLQWLREGDGICWEATCGIMNEEGILERLLVHGRGSG